MIEKLVSKRSWIAINAGILLCAAAVPSAVLAQTQSSGGVPAPSASSKLKATTLPGSSLSVHNAQTATTPQSAGAQVGVPPGNNGQPLPCTVIPGGKGEPEVFLVGGQNGNPPNSIPPQGTTIHPGDVVGAIYIDETPLNGGPLPPGHAGVPLIPPLFKLDGTQVTPPLPTLTADPSAGQNGTDITVRLPLSESPGLHTIDIDGWDTDQNKGGDCGHIHLEFTVTAPPFSITKDVLDAGGHSINGTTVPKGTTLNYVVTVTNTSSTLAGDPGNITDIISKIDPSLFTVSSAPSGPGTITPDPSIKGDWKWDPGSIAAGSNAKLTLSVVVNSIGGEIDNSACLLGAACPPPCPTSSTCCPTTANAVTVCNFTPAPFTVAKDVLDSSGNSIKGKTVPKGTQLHYVVTVTNAGTAAGDPGVITDKLSKLDPSLFVVDSEPTGPGSITGATTGSQGPWTWDPGSIDVGKSAQLSMLVTVNAAGGEIDNSACLPGAAACPPVCPTSSTCCPTTDTAVTVCNFTTPTFSVAKAVFDANGTSINGQTVPAGTTLHYVVTVTNNGTGAGDPGVVNDKITKIDPSLFSVVSGPNGPGTITSVSPGAFTWDPGSIPGNGGTAQLKLDVKVTASGGEIDNSACLPGAAACPTPCPTSSSCPGPCTATSNTATSATVCNFLPVIGLAKCIVTATDCVNTTTQAVGDTVTYKVTATNPAANTAAAANVLVDDVVSTPDKLPFIVNDGVNLNSSNAQTTDSFQGSPVVSVTKVGTNHYQWTFPSLAPGQSGVVTFSITIGTPTPPAAGTRETLHVDNTASEPTFKPPSVTVHSNVPLTGGVLACTTATCPPATPKTGTELNLRIASGFFVSGLFLILFGLASRPRRRRLA